jgi:hypothetical protein
LTGGGAVGRCGGLRGGGAGASAVRGPATASPAVLRVGGAAELTVGAVVAGDGGFCAATRAGVPVGAGEGVLMGGPSPWAPVLPCAVRGHGMPPFFLLGRPLADFSRAPLSPLPWVRAASTAAERMAGGVPSPFKNPSRAPRVVVGAARFRGHSHGRSPARWPPQLLQSAAPDRLPPQ